MQPHLSFLATSAEDLDLTAADDRAIFRMRVSDRLKATTVEAMREWVAGAMRDRYSASRAVADTYIAEHLRWKLENREALCLDEDEIADIAKAIGIAA